MRITSRLIIPALLLSAGPALAHHPLAGLPMETGAQGLLSGLAHPVLGFDHLFFVLAVGVAAVLAGLGVVQYALALGAGTLAVAARAERVRLAGAMVAGVGLFLSLEAMEAPLVALIARVAG